MTKAATTHSSYAALEQRFRELGNLGHAQAMLGWDEAVMMPVGGGERRGDVLATLAGIVHRQLTSPEIGRPDRGRRRRSRSR